MSETLGVSSQLVYQTKSALGKSRDSIDIPFPAPLDLDIPQLPHGEYQLFLEGLRLFTGVLGKGIAATVEYSVSLFWGEPGGSCLEDKVVESGRMTGSPRLLEFRSIIDFHVDDSATSPPNVPSTRFLRIHAKRIHKSMHAPRIRARLIRRLEAKPTLPTTFDPLASASKTAVEELFGAARPDITCMLQQLYRGSEAYRNDNLMLEHRTSMAKTETVWWPREGDELWSQRTKMTYTIRRKVGEGGYGVAFLAQDFYGQRYILKASKTFFSKQKVEEEWRKETKLMLAVNHPNVVQLYDAFTWSGLYWVVIEECEGSFASYVKKKGRLSSTETIDVAAQLLSGLEHIHRRNIIHRDVQMDNVLYSKSLFTDSIVVKLTDFGISKFIGEGSALVAYTAVGRAYDMSPEVAQMEGSFTVGVSDVYQLGLVLYHVLTGGPALSEADGPPLEAIHTGLARQRAEQLGTKLGGVISMMLRRRIEHRLTARDAWLKLREIRDDPDGKWEIQSGEEHLEEEPESQKKPLPPRRNRQEAGLSLRREYSFLDYDDDEDSSQSAPATPQQNPPPQQNQPILMPIEISGDNFSIIQPPPPQQQQVSPQKPAPLFSKRPTAPPVIDRSRKGQSMTLREAPSINRNQKPPLRPTTSATGLASQVGQPDSEYEYI
eukprot:CAMPEP_0201501126 /NCGR_PEP_ID=MMETSP0151_2-20130828/83421_1 /ASSEMBLY_ACC=CAM_ASM_000257 /TAXON_ID=200890 /ORGANISM="Paramoeba atlantica, Strain 621/1 / CCAP 1560/9" /LENGTH=659 /DNA_ID=CAMNT_0047894605 /DNA_START=46 /DNA_END=2025 /DNA_ORIENTATION=+